MSNSEFKSDDMEPGDPIKRLEELRKQADIIADDIDDSAAKRYARRAGACAESALVMLQGPEILDEEVDHDV